MNLHPDYPVDVQIAVVRQAIVRWVSDADPDADTLVLLERAVGVYCGLMRDQRGMALGMATAGTSICSAASSPVPLTTGVQHD